MGLSVSSNLTGFQKSFFGIPFVHIDSSANTNSNHNPPYTTTSLGGHITPFFGASGALVEVTTNNVYVKSGGQWVQCLTIHVNINGNWRRVSNDNFYVKDGNFWKD
jgi:hypothetical protein